MGVLYHRRPRSAAASPRIFSPSFSPFSGLGLLSFAPYTLAPDGFASPHGPDRPERP